MTPPCMMYSQERRMKKICVLFSESTCEVRKRIFSASYQKTVLLDGAMETLEAIDS
jgi:hypothetical protein